MKKISLLIITSCTLHLSGMQKPLTTAHPSLIHDFTLTKSTRTRVDELITKIARAFVQVKNGDRISIENRNLATNELDASTLVRIAKSITARKGQSTTKKSMHHILDFTQCIEIIQKPVLEQLRLMKNENETLLIKLKKALEENSSQKKQIVRNEKQLSQNQKHIQAVNDRKIGQLKQTLEQTKNDYEKELENQKSLQEKIYLLTNENSNLKKTSLANNIIKDQYHSYILLTGITCFSLGLALPTLKNYVTSYLFATR